MPHAGSLQNCARYITAHRSIFYSTVRAAFEGLSGAGSPSKQARQDPWMGLSAICDLDLLDLDAGARGTGRGQAAKIDSDNDCRDDEWLHLTTPSGLS